MPSAEHKEFRDIQDGGRTTSAGKQPVVDEIHPQPFLDVNASAFTLSPDGSFALVAGSHSQASSITKCDIQNACSYRRSYRIRKMKW